MTVGILSCGSDNNDPILEGPAITVTPSTVSGEVGEQKEVTITWVAESGVSSITSSSQNATFTNNPSGNSGSFTATVTVSDANENITFTVTDTNNDMATAQLAVTSSDVVTIADGDLQANQTYTWTKNKEYLLDGLVYLEAGGVLNIEAGTVIKAKKTPSTTDATSSLVITAGAKIEAIGTAAEPIIFTAEDDDLNGSLGPDDNQQWAGLIVLGNAPAHKKGAETGIQIEGIDSNETRGQFGGSNVNDNSGTLKYVSIRYTGFALNGQAGDEIQGLTLGGVGAGTTIDYIDIFSSADDGIEIFGGTVNIKHISVAFSTDDDFDFDLGWRGNAQFLFALMGDDNIGFDHAGEWDGASPDDAPLFTAPNIFNATFIGPGAGGTARDKAILMRENFAGKLGNSILEDFPSVGIEVQDIDGTNDAYNNITTAKDGFLLEILNNTWANFGGATDLASLVKASTTKDDNGNVTFQGSSTAVVAELTDNGNKYTSSGVLQGISRIPNGGLDPRPTAEDATVSTVPAGMEQVNYRGAFSASENWLSGWSTLAKLGYLGN